MSTKVPFGVAAACLLVLLLTGCAASRARLADTSGPGFTPLANTEILTNLNDRRTWIDAPGREF